MNALSYIGWLTAIGGTLLSVWVTAKQLLLITVRLNANDSLKLSQYLSGKRRHEFILNEEFDSNHRNTPKVFAKLMLVGRLALWYSSEERLLTTGHDSKEYVAELTLLRFQRDRLRALLEATLATSSTQQPDVSVVQPYGYFYQLGQVSDHNLQSDRINLPDDVYEQIDREIAACAGGQQAKTGLLLHGLPGNGKSSLFRHFAAKYNLPINMFQLESFYTNRDIMSMFAKIPPRCIVLFEDFDSAFDGRQCLLGAQQAQPGTPAPASPSVGFTFDSILNGLDGVYSRYEGVVFFMTANALNKIDDAIKNRPSRFKYCIEVGNPSRAMVKTVLNGHDAQWGDKVYGHNLDRLCWLRDLLDSGADPALIERQLRPAQ